MFEASLDFFWFQHDFIIPDGAFKIARSSKWTSEIIVQSSENRLALVLYDGKEKDNEKDFDFSTRIGIKRLWRFDASHAHRGAASHRASDHCDSFSAGGCNTASNFGAHGYPCSAYTNPAGVVVTATSANTAAAPAATATSSGPATATATLPSDAGGLSKAGVVLFSNLTRSGSYFNFRCPPQDLTFSVSTSSVYVIEVDLYYRMEDLTTQPTSISAWKNYGKMNGDKNGNYTLDINTLQLSPDLRTPAKSWFDYQFIGIAKMVIQSEIVA